MARKFLGLLALVSLFAWFSPVLAAKPNYAPEFPQNNGTYDVPGHPNLKVKVFVHKPNPGKPGPAPAPTCSDLHVNSVVGGTGWHLPSSFMYTLNPASVPSSVKGSNLSSIAALASGAWKTAISNKVNINQNPQTTTINRAVNDGKNIVAWGRTSGSALAVTYTWYSLPDKTVTESDIIMNSKFRWSWNVCSDSSYDAQNILTHEMGHWMGLDDEYDSAHVDNTMYGYGSTGEFKKDTLEAGDITGVNAVYQ
ncbi:MAG: hypothetical protein A2Z52_01075 [Candidatus Moranbacteria bacterium RBG_19FT_COMBO_42_6]|nr:MAG: hypothetical protein A2Z52_01075 [Candidatus Moranbacteria bacterium RBG_19FT_COMBO_42_6]